MGKSGASHVSCSARTRQADSDCSRWPSQSFQIAPYSKGAENTQLDQQGHFVLTQARFVSFRLHAEPKNQKTKTKQGEVTFTTRLTNTLFKDLNKPCVTLKCDNMLVSPRLSLLSLFSSSDL